MKNLIEQLLQNSKNSADENFFQFIKNFYSQNQSYDFTNYDVEALNKLAHLSFEFFQNRKSDETKIRISNPADSFLTVIDITTADAPFLIDSIVTHLDTQGIKIRNIIHPIYSSTRDKSGKLEKFGAGAAESVIQLHIEKITSANLVKKLEENIRKIIDAVDLVVADWKPMMALANEASKQIENAKKLKISDSEISEAQKFISWINDGNFIFLAAKEFEIKEVKKGEYALDSKDEGLGVFRSNAEDFKPKVANSSLEEVADSLKNPYVIEILKSRYRSQIHRIANAERIRVQKISTDGKVVGEFRFIGLFTSAAYHNSTHEIPLLRSKIEKVIADSGYTKGSHNYKDLVSTLEAYPRDELFQISAEDLLRNATGIVSICGRSQVKFFARNDKFNRFVSCLVFVPRDHSDSNLREKIKSYLAKVYNGEVTDSFVQITESNLVRLHTVIRTEKGIPSVDPLMVEKEIDKMSRVWSDDLSEAIRAKFENDEESVALFTKYKEAFSVSYINRFDAKRGAIDISRVEEALKADSVLFNLYKSSDSPENISELKIYSPTGEIMLSDVMPVLESFGFNVIQEHSYPLSVEGKKVWIHYFRVNLDKSGTQFSEKIKINFEKTISLIWTKTAQVGFLNKLLVAADLNWKQIYMLCAYTKYLYQTGFRYNQTYIADVLIKYSSLAKLLVELFEAKFDTSVKLTIDQRNKIVEEISAKIKDGLNSVKDVTDDAVIRRFYGTILATIRTNYYQSASGGGFKGYMSFKFDCAKVPGLPLPVPHAEIFVFSPRFEAVHLRGGKVARGGLRWSDRQEDFRTEILGLVKAQMTKNAVIVPVGSKGGFVLKRSMDGLSRDEIQKEGIECYKTFLSGLLDITDNVVNGKIEHPKDVVMHDGIDPYLVVAADKGTATFSDIANSVSAQYNFWLGDAFASGGSVGYDHKKMGITAKGGWISVMRHFQEMGRDSQTQDFTCVGIGDMAGDVFGNGMLLSKHIKLVGAFNHMHIFLDPNPDAAKSFVERERMFNLPRSTWMDYDKALISQGGGIFERSAKSIKLTPEVKAILHIEEDELAPNDLIRAMIKAPVDLLWNGGIGTYVKSTDETHQDVGDRATDALRVNGNELRCKVVGEGGNLGCTQKGRIEYALNGGRINTDAMDNSAGVDCSDHEVNIKIAMTQALRAGKITLEERNKILESMTANVSDLVLADNRLQTQAISIANFQGALALGEQSQFLSSLEKSGFLNRAIEFLPSKKEIEKRQMDRVGLTRPELCVMLAYSKMDIYQKLLASDLVNDKYFESELFCYFPKLMQEKFAHEISTHQLRKEIIATQITNFVVNRIGVSFINQICEDSGFSLPDVVRSFIIACDSFSIRQIWEEVEKLDGKVDFQIQMKMFLSANKLIERSVNWLLRNQAKGEISSIVTRFKKIADELYGIFPEILAQASRESFERKVSRYCLSNVERKLAEKVSAMDPVASAFDIAEISAQSNFDLKTIAKIYFAVGTRFSLKWMRSRVSSLSIDSYWQRLSAKTILEDLYSYQMKLAAEIVGLSCDDKKICEINSIEKWTKKMEFSVERFDNFIDELKSLPSPDLAVFIVALNRLKPLVK
jgi:glutamate dehydrogenase